MAETGRRRGAFHPALTLTAGTCIVFPCSGDIHRAGAGSLVVSHESALRESASRESTANGANGVYGANSNDANDHGVYDYGVYDYGPDRREQRRRLHIELPCREQ